MIAIEPHTHGHTIAVFCFLQPEKFDGWQIQPRLNVQHSMFCKVLDIGHGRTPALCQLTEGKVILLRQFHQSIRDYVDNHMGENAYRNEFSGVKKYTIKLCS